MQVSVYSGYGRRTRRRRSRRLGSFGRARKGAKGRLGRAAKACKGKTKGKFRACMRAKLRKGGSTRRRRKSRR